MKRAAFFCLIFLCLFMISCQTKYETVYEGVIKNVSYIKNNWSGDYYMVTFTGGLEIRVSRNEGDLPEVGKRYKVIRCHQPLAGTWHKLERIKEEK